MAEQADQSANNNAQSVGCLILIVLIVIGAIASAFGLGDDSSGEPDGPDEYGAIDVCHQWVEDRLRAPATADFSDEDWTRDGNTYTVSGSVDSENGFGALLRSRWTCTARWIEGTSWRGNAVVLG